MMLRALTIHEQVANLKVAQGAMILSHHYQDSEIQEVADVVGDTMELAQAAQKIHSHAIAVCGAKFMAETVKVMSPGSTVVMPEARAGCSLVDSCPAAAIQAFRKRHPKYVIVSYINTSIEVKAESDVVCTARNAVAVVNSIPAERPVLFVPDSNLGNWVQKQTGRKNMQIWQGACIVHATFSLRRLMAARTQHPMALIVAHPECPAEISAMADFTGSATDAAAWCGQQQADEFIVLLDSGIRYAMEKNAPGKKFYFVASEGCNCSECPYLRMNTLEKLVTCLETLSPRIEVSDNLVARARVPIERMLRISTLN